jgi:uncharacterized membrane protein
MYRSRYSSDLRSKYDTARTTVRADTIFTMPAGILQPITGIALISMTGHDALELWLVASYGLFLLAGLCWLPVVWIQIRLGNMVLTSLETGNTLPDDYHRLFRVWTALGWPAFIALIVVFYLMVAKPTW